MLDANWSYRYLHRLAIRFVAFAVVLALIAGCYEQDHGNADDQVVGQQPEATRTHDLHERDATPNPEVTPEEKHATPPPERTGEPPDPSKPYGHFIEVTFGPAPTPEDTGRLANLVVTGHIVEILPAEWTTPDGQRPDNPHTSNPEEVYIITPVVIELDGPSLVNRIDADLSSGQVVVAAYGGRVGEDRIKTNAPSQDFAVGERVVAVLSEHPYLRGNVEKRYETAAGLAWNVAKRYTLTEEGVAVPTNPNGKQLPTPELIDRITMAAEDNLDEARATPDPDAALPEKEHGPLPTPPRRDSNDPITSGTEVTFGVPPTPVEIGRGESLVVTGEVVEILSAEWATPDGQRPENPWEPGVVPEQYPVITPIVIALDAPPLVNRAGADLSSGQVVVAAYGGQVGEDKVWTNDPSQHFQMGERVLVILANRPYLQGGVEKRYETSAGLAWNAGLKFTFTESGMAVPSNPNAKRLPTSELIARIKTAAETP